MCPTDEETRTVPLIELAVARSGDKGNHANIGVIARKPEYLGPISRALTEAAVEERFLHVLKGEVDRFYLPGIGRSIFSCTTHWVAVAWHP